MSNERQILLNIAFEWKKLSETRVVTQILVLALVIGKGEEWKMKYWFGTVKTSVCCSDPYQTQSQ